jgi:hypothetical protein
MNMNPYKIRRTSKGRHIDILEQFFIQKYTRENTYRDAGKSLALPGRKEANVFVRIA